MPRRYSFAEDKIKASVKAILIRGKVEVSVMVEYITENDMTIKLNEPLARQYYDNLRELKENFGLSGDISLEMIANMPDVLKAIPDVEDEEEITKAILIPVEPVSYTHLDVYKRQIFIFAPESVDIAANHDERGFDFGGNKNPWR